MGVDEHSTAAHVLTKANAKRSTAQMSYRCRPQNAQMANLGS